MFPISCYHPHEGYSISHAAFSSVFSPIPTKSAISEYRTQDSNGGLLARACSRDLTNRAAPFGSTAIGGILGAAPRAAAVFEQPRELTSGNGSLINFHQGIHATLNDFVDCSKEMKK